MKIEIKPCTVVVDDEVVASYDTVTSATAFRHGVEWERKRHKENVSDQADAWMAVTKVLNEVYPEWHSLGKNGMTSAVAAIRRLRERK